MLNNFEKEKLLHSLKRAAHVMSFLKEEIASDRGKSLLSLLVEELDCVANDVNGLTEKKDE